jgi:hypothetical protein
VPGEDASRLLCPALRAGLYGARPDGNSFGAARHLLATQFVKFDAGRATAKYARNQRVVTVTNEMDGFDHRYAFASMKARVLRRASSSLNCCGGDFMK